jgi:cyanate lyase
MMHTITIDPANYNERDIDFISDMLCEMIAEKYGHVVEAISFSIEVSYEAAPEEAD